jgi:uncharacterized metal-binding protein
MSEKVKPVCAKCGVYKCRDPGMKKEFPNSCPNKKYPDVKEWSIEEGVKPGNMEINWACDEVSYRQKDEKGNYTWTRIREVMEYSNMMGYKKLGMGYCVGLKNEAKMVADILEKNGFDIVSVACMAGAPTRDEAGLEKHPGTGDIVCNPIMQAEVLNREETELNIMLGLCIGHDILFINYSKADVTPLAVKDRILAHNPMGAIYTSNSYYQKKLYHQP